MSVTQAVSVLPDVYRELAIAHALALEINTGMKHSKGSIMNLAREVSGTLKRTKRGVLGDYVKYLGTVIPGYQPSPNIAQALVK